MTKKNNTNVILYGLQRSGTNFLEVLLRENYKISLLNSDHNRRSPYQKHCRLYKEKSFVPEPQYWNDINISSFNEFESLFEIAPDYYLVVSKDPYSWYLSYLKWARKCNWPSVDHHYIVEYNLFYKFFIDLASQTNKFLFVRYVDLLKDEKEALKKISLKLCLKKRVKAYFRVEIPLTVPYSEPFSKVKNDYYLEEQYLREYRSCDLEIINDLLDPGVISYLGYKMRSLHIS